MENCDGNHRVEKGIMLIVDFYPQDKEKYINKIIDDLSQETSTIPRPVIDQKFRSQYEKCQEYHYHKYMNLNKITPTMGPASCHFACIKETLKAFQKEMIIKDPQLLGLINDNN